jgi:thermitase
MKSTPSFPRGPTPRLAVAAALLLAACSDGPTDTPARPKPQDRIVSFAMAPGGVVEFVPGQIVVRFAPGSSGEAAAQQIVAAHGGTLKQDLLLPDTWTVAVPVGREKAAAAELSALGTVDFAEPDWLMAVVPCETGNCNNTTDSFLGYKWDLHNDGTINNAAGTVLASTGKVDADVDWLEAFNHLGSAFAGTAVIGIVDTGIRATHQDLAGRVIGAKNFATGYPDTLIADRVGHGTHVAGIAAARGNNGVGVAGVAYGANIKLLSAKACELYLFPGNVIDTSCPNSSIANAIVWAVDNGADAINISLGGSPAATTGPAVLQSALQYARANNVLPFCSTGNDNYPGVAFPARFPECVAVGATDWGDNRASYSNYGAEVALSAPGGDGESLPNGYSLILSADYTADNSYTWMAGTSMATPQAAGLAGLLFANGLTADSVLARLTSTADDLGPAGRDPEYGFGRINAYQAVTGLRLFVMDVQPGTVSLSRSATVSVYLYSTATFNAAGVSASAARLHPNGTGAGAPVAQRSPGVYFSTVRDYNGDARPDQLLVFRVSDLAAAGMTTATTSFLLKGSGYAGNDPAPPTVAP